MTLKWRRGAIGLSIVFALCGATVAKPTAKEVPLPDPRGTEQQPMVIKGAISTSTSDNPDPEKKADDHRVATYTLVTGVATLLLFVVAAVQAGFFWRQLGIMKSSLRDTREAADAAKASADALPLIERAYVYLDRIEIKNRRFATSTIYEGATNERKDFVNLDFGVTFKNHGKTPAKVTEVGMTMLLTDDPENDPKLANAGFTPGLIIGAQSIYRVELDGIRVDPVRWAAAKDAINDRPIFHLHGHINYLDVMREPRVTAFSWVGSARDFEFRPSLLTDRNFTEDDG